jgi:hypothetical protein
MPHFLLVCFSWGWHSKPGRIKTLAGCRRQPVCSLVTRIWLWPRSSRRYPGRYRSVDRWVAYWRSADGCIAGGPLLAQRLHVEGAPGHRPIDRMQPLKRQRQPGLDHVRPIEALGRQVAEVIAHRLTISRYNCRRHGLMTKMSASRQP